MKINEVIIRRINNEQATAGATSAGNIATLNNPHVAAGPDRFKKSYTGTPGRSGTKAPRLPKIVQPVSSLACLNFIKGVFPIDWVNPLRTCTLFSSLLCSRLMNS